MNCPILLLNIVNTIYYYQATDCSVPGSSYSLTTAAPLQCGCSISNPDCSGAAMPMPMPTPTPPPTPPMPPAPGSGLGPMPGMPGGISMKTSTGSVKTVGMAPTSKTAKRVPEPEDHIVHPKLAAAGIGTKLAHDVEWRFPSAWVNPMFDGEEAFHVVKIDGKDRIVRVIHAVISAPKNLYQLSTDGHTARIDPLPNVKLCVGQEAHLPNGLDPKKLIRMEVVGKRKAGSYHVRLKRSGAKADPTVFHVILTK